MDIIYTLIIPHFNIPQLLMRLLKTVPQRSDLQIIVVDDCSTSGLEQLNQLQCEYNWVDWYSTGINGGGGKARNVGLSHAKGKYVIFADADDYFNLCFNECLDKYQDSDYDIVYFTSNSVDVETFQKSDRDDPITIIVNKYIDSKNPKDLLYKFTAPWSKFISLEMISKNQIQFLESNVYNDMHFSLLTEIYAKNITADAHAIYCVTSRSESVSSVTKPEKEVEKMHVIASYCELAKRHNVNIVPLWYLVGPMMDAFRHNKWDTYRDKAVAYFSKVGIGRGELRKQYSLFFLHKKVLQPCRQVLQSIINIFKNL